MAAATIMSAILRKFGTMRHLRVVSGTDLMEQTNDNRAYHSVARIRTINTVQCPYLYQLIKVLTGVLPKIIFCSFMYFSRGFVHIRKTYKCDSSIMHNI